MASFRFIHAADLHLDTPFSGIGRGAANVRDHLRDDSLEAFDNLIQAAIDHDAAFLLLAGDLYDGAERGVRAQMRFLRGVERLAERGTRVFVVHGNHDPLDGWSAIRETPDSLTIFGSQEVESHAVERDGERLAFVEVRARRGTAFGTPKESVTARKQARLVTVALNYLQEHSYSDVDWGIDVVALQFTPRGVLQHMEVIRNAVMEMG